MNSSKAVSEQFIIMIGAGPSWLFYGTLRRNIHGQRTWNMLLAILMIRLNYLCLTCYAADIKEIAVYRYFSEKNSHRMECDGTLS